MASPVLTGHLPIFLWASVFKLVPSKGCLAAPAQAVPPGGTPGGGNCVGERHPPSGRLMRRRPPPKALTGQSPTPAQLHITASEQLVLVLGAAEFPNVTGKTYTKKL